MGKWTDINGRVGGKGEVGGFSCAGTVTVWDDDVSPSTMSAQEIMPTLARAPVQAQSKDRNGMGTGSDTGKGGTG